MTEGTGLSPDSLSTVHAIQPRDKYNHVPLRYIWSYRPNCAPVPVPAIRMLRSKPPGPQIMTVFGDGSFKKVIKVKGGH